MALGKKTSGRPRAGESARSRRESRLPQGQRAPARAPTTGRHAVIDAIVDSAHQLLAQSGYAAVSTNRIARAANISIGALYHYFPNKEAIVAELARRLELRGLE